MLAIFSDLVEKCIEVFMDDFSVFGSSFDTCLGNLDTVLKRCVETNLVQNWEIYILSLLSAKSICKVDSSTEQ
uniref:Reverse transcriptase domain-containing protein n=1 Tax=Cajanus cajan TaxID=3821 RepID=A0A151TRG0_CAJCA|nr:hypothetical protein KK1_008837 [Cajanus cajan]